MEVRLPWHYLKQKRELVAFGVVDKKYIGLYFAYVGTLFAQDTSVIFNLLVEQFCQQFENLST